MRRKNKKHFRCEDDEQEEDEKYFSKDPRFFYGRKDPHTLRKVLKYRRKIRSIVREKNYQSYGFDARCATDIPVTVIDEMFDAGFAINDQTQQSTRPITEDDEYETVKEMLDESCVRQWKEYVKGDGSLILHYEIPIIGYQEKTLTLPSFQEFVGNDIRRAIRGKMEAKTGLNLRYWPYIQGKFWDPSYLYVATFDGKYHPVSNWDVRLLSLKPITSLLGSQKHKEMMRLGWISEDMHRIAKRSYSEPLFPGRKQKRGQMLQKGHLEVDLQSVCNISHIGIIGGYPANYDLHSYPSRHGSTDEVNGILPFRRMSISSICIVDPSKLNYVTQYTLQYRHPTSNAWCDFGGALAGNVNMHEEVTHKVSIRARFLRFRPTEHHNRLEFTVFVYGHAVEDGRFPVLNDDMMRKNRVGTIKYSLYPAQSLSYRHDGCGHHSDWYGFNQSQWQRKHELEQSILEDSNIERHKNCDEF